MTWLARLRAYGAHGDPAAEAANIVALVVGWNGPFYPLYVVALAGTQALWPSLLTMLATPFFLAAPWLSRLSSPAARFGFVLVGTLNTVWCTKLMGAASGVGLFLLPCAALTALLFRTRERWLMWSALALPVAAYFVPDRAYGPPLMALDAQAAARLGALNAASVLMLTAFIALRFASLLRQAEAMPAPML